MIINYSNVNYFHALGEIEMQPPKKKKSRDSNGSNVSSKPLLDTGIYPLTPNYP